jgi:hypothetical protein
MKLFYNEVLNTDSVIEVSNAIKKIREKSGKTLRRNIPI